ASKIGRPPGEPTETTFGRRSSRRATRGGLNALSRERGDAFAFAFASDGCGALEPSMDEASRPSMKRERERRSRRSLSLAAAWCHAVKARFIAEFGNRAG